MSGAVAASDLLHFKLTDDAFNNFWNNVITAEDASEYVDFMGGKRIGARFVCALYYLTDVDRRRVASDVILRAYGLAKDLPADALTSTKSLYEAQALYDSDAVRTLLDRVRYRTARAAEQRVESLTVSKIEELYDRTRKPKDSDEAAEMAFNNPDGIPDPEAKRKTEAMALDASIRFLSNRTRERSLEQTRRDKRAILAAMDANRNARGSSDRPPTLAEAKFFLRELKEHLPPEEYSELVRDAVQEALPPAIDG